VRGGRRRSPARRDELLELATDVFAEKGYVNATVRDIAERAGMLSGSLYYHFKSKDAVLAEILLRALTKLYDQYEAAAETAPDGRATVEALIRVGLRFVTEERAVAKIVQNDFPYLRTAPNFEFVNEMNSRIKALWLSSLERALATGDLHADIDVGLAYRTLLGTIMSTVRWAHPERVLEFEDLLIRLALDGVHARGSLTAV
jgi:AcrR family transcriptional regulator